MEGDARGKSSRTKTFPCSQRVVRINSLAFVRGSDKMDGQMDEKENEIKWRLSDFLGRKRN